MTKSNDHDDSALPPLPNGHGFFEGDRVQFRVWGRGTIQGTIQDIDISFGGKRYKGLAILGDDQRYYELVLDATDKIETES